MQKRGRKTRAVLMKSEDCMDLSFKASGMNITELMENLDAGTGAMIGSCMELYKESKELAIAYAKVMDKLLEEISNERIFRRS